MIRADIRPENGVFEFHTEGTMLELASELCAMVMATHQRLLRTHGEEAAEAFQIAIRAGAETGGFAWGVNK